MIFKSIHSRAIGHIQSAHIGSKAIILCSICIILYSLMACNPEAPAHTKNVEINMDVQQVSAGYAHITFSTNKNAFYLIGIQPAQEDVDPQKVAKHFMIMALDRAYVDYLYWRNQQLQELTPFIADFASHSLQYGTVEHFLNRIKIIGCTPLWSILLPTNQQVNCLSKLFIQMILPLFLFNSTTVLREFGTMYIQWIV